VQIERRETHVEVVFGLESFDLNEADVAPRSDEVRDDDDRSALWLQVYRFVFCHRLVLSRRVV
jgi:hypothetical protein